MTSPYRAPDEPGATPEEPAPDGLGELVSTHTQGRITRRVFALGFGIAILTSILAVQTKHLAPFVIGVAVLLALLPIWLLSELLIGLGSAVELWDEGLVLRRRWTDPVSVRWDDVDAIYIDLEVASSLGVQRIPTAKVTLTTHEGRRIVIPRGLTRAAEILAAVDRRIERPLLAPARKALAAGEPLTFGPLVLDGRGVTAKDQTLAWDDVALVEAEPDRLAIHEKGRDAGSSSRVLDLAVRELPHPRVLVQLLASRVNVEASPVWGE